MFQILRGWRFGVRFPESHYLYHIKDKCDSTEPMSNTEAVALDGKYVENQAEKAKTDPKRDMPTVEIDEETEEVKETGESL